MKYFLSNDLYAPTKAMSSVSALDDGLLCSWLVIPPFCVFFFFLLDSPLCVSHLYGRSLLDFSRWANLRVVVMSVALWD